jgi:hypothetical protein
MINKSQYQKIHTQNLNQNEADRKWRLFEEEQAAFNMQTSPISPMGGRRTIVAPPAPELLISIPVANWTATFSGVSLENEGNLITLGSGGVVNFFADLSLDYVFDPVNCPFCIVQYYVGLYTDGVTQTDPLYCISVGPGDPSPLQAQIMFDVTIPDVPGIYYISSTDSLNTSCNPTAVFPQTNVLGIVVIP